MTLLLILAFVLAMFYIKEEFRMVHKEIKKLSDDMKELTRKKY